MFKRYYENTRHFKCPDCGMYFTQSLWKWTWGMKIDFVRYRYVRCPYCKTYNWLKAIKKEN